MLSIYTVNILIIRELHGNFKFLLENIEQVVGINHDPDN